MSRGFFLEGLAMAYILNENRYSQMEYRRCGNSGLKLPLLSLGLWHNFGDTNSPERMAQLCETAFDGGITHFDLANNYGRLLVRRSETSADC